MTALASGTVATVASAPRPAFRRDDAGGDVPLAGLVLLGLLVGVAVVVLVRRRHALPAAWQRAIAGVRPASAAALRVVASARLDGSARVHVLECGGQRYLVGCNGQQAIDFIACPGAAVDAAGDDA